MKRICVNCGSSPGKRPVYREAARRLGGTLVNRGLDLVYGGAEVGLMGEVANAVINAGGAAIGVIPRSFAHKVCHRGLKELHIVESMHERKQMMFDLSDAFIALPGGFGTLDEVTELLTWSQLGLHGKPCGFINVSGYFDPLLAFLDRAVTEGFMKREHREMLLVSDEADDLIDRFGSYCAPNIEKWVDISSRT